MAKYFLNIVLFLVLIGTVSGQSQELIVKAAYLEKFALFTEWPSDDFEDENSTFIIKVYENKEFYKIVKKFYSDHKIRERKVEVEFVKNVNEIKNCHALYITKTTLSKLKEILNYTKNKPILTVSDTKGYANQGVIINLVVIKNKVRFEINEKAIAPSGLVLSYHLLKFAKIVDSLNN